MAFEDVAGIDEADAELIDAEIRRIIEECLDDADRRLAKHRDGAIATAGPGGVSVRVGRPGIPTTKRSVAPALQTSTPPSTSPATSH